MESAQEGMNTRTVTLHPAAIATGLLDDITDEGAAAGMAALYDGFAISPDRMADVVAFAINEPEDTNVNEFTVGPTPHPW